MNRDGGSTALYLLTLLTWLTLLLTMLIFTFDMVYTVDILYTVHMVDTVDTVYIIPTAKAHYGLWELTPLALFTMLPSLRRLTLLVHTLCMNTLFYYDYLCHQELENIQHDGHGD